MAAAALQNDAVIGVYHGPTAGKLRGNPVGGWRGVNMAVFPSALALLHENDL